MLISATPTWRARSSRLNTRDCRRKRTQSPNEYTSSAITPSLVPIGVSRVYRYCIKSRYPQHIQIECNSTIEHVTGNGDSNNTRGENQNGNLDTAADEWPDDQI